MALILNKILVIKKLHYFDPRYNLKKIKIQCFILVFMELIVISCYALAILIML